MPQQEKSQTRLNWPLIKVCGIRTPEEGLLALSSGANTIGVLVGLTHKANDEVTPEMARNIRAIVHAAYIKARVVMVTHLLDHKAVIDRATLIGADAVQIHDNMSLAHIKRLRTALPSIEIIKAIQIGDDDPATLIAYARNYEPYVDAFLTDSKAIDADGRLRIGGTGKRHDAVTGRKLVEAFPHKPVVLAGGLNPENVMDAILDIGPAGIDANSGLENPDGSKNATKINKFAAAGNTCVRKECPAV